MNWMPHGVCWRWDPLLVAAEVGSNSVIALSFFSLTASLVRMWWISPGRKFAVLPLVFAAVTSFCACTHVMDVVTVWLPWFWVDANMRISAAIMATSGAWLFWGVVDMFAGLHARIRELEAQIDRLRG